MSETQATTLVERLEDVGCDREPFTAAHKNCICRLTNEAAREIIKLTSQLEEARAKAIHECAQVAENCDTLGPSYQDDELTSEGMYARKKVRQIATAIRALLHGSTK